MWTINNIKVLKFHIQLFSPISTPWNKLSLVSVFLVLLDFLDTVEDCEANDLDHSDEVSCKYHNYRSLDDQDDLWRGWWFREERSWQSELCILINLHKRRWLISWLIHVLFYFVEERRFLEKLSPSLDRLVLRPGGAGGVLPGHRGGHVERQQAQDAVLSAKMK